MNTMVKHLKKTLAKRKLHAEVIAASMQVGLETLAKMKDDSKIRYRVELFDGWPDEKDVTLERRGSLKVAMQSATKKYKTVNKRGDVQARCHVYAIIPGVRSPITLSEELWRSLFKKFAER